MKTLGLIGGTSWVSTLEYYRFMNELVNEKLGGGNYARLIIHSLNYGEVKKNNESNNWQANLQMILDACENMKAGGAKGIVLCANTMHMFAEEVEEKIQLPVIHIAEATATAIREKSISKVGLLGTRFTMEKEFFKRKLAERSIECIVPDEADRDFIHQTIADELGNGIFKEETQSKYLQIIQKLTDAGCDGVILGCTEIPLLIQQDDSPVPVFDTTFIHSQAAAAFMCA